MTNVYCTVGTLEEFVGQKEGKKKVAITGSFASEMDIPYCEVCSASFIKTDFVFSITEKKKLYYHKGCFISFVEGAPTPKLENKITRATRNTAVAFIKEELSA